MASFAAILAVTKLIIIIIDAVRHEVVTSFTDTKQSKTFLHLEDTLTRLALCFVWTPSSHMGMTSCAAKR